MNVVIHFTRSSYFVGTVCQSTSTARPDQPANVASRQPFSAPVSGVVPRREAVSSELVGTARVPQQAEVGEPDRAPLQRHQQRLQLLDLTAAVKVGVVKVQGGMAVSEGRT